MTTEAAGSGRAWLNAVPNISGCGGWEAGARVFAMILLMATVAMATIDNAPAPANTPSAIGTTAAPLHDATRAWGREILLAGYAGGPLYYPSDLHMTRSDGTDVTLKGLGWDSDVLYFPIDGGVRSVEYFGSVGVMIDFLHNKAIARLGKGAHGRKLANPVVETVEATGMIKGQPAPARIKLTDLFDRLEFTHGHNMLMLTPLVSLGTLASRFKPYAGVGAGFALPHVEVWFPGEPREHRTNEYQLAGPVVQAVVGLEMRTGRGSWFIEYKFSKAWISGELTGDQSWKNFNMPGDLARQFMRWWTSEPARFGTIRTTLTAHQLVGGGGYWTRWGRAGDALR